MVYTPSAINKYIKSIIDNDKYLREFMITGEVSNVKHHNNGNIYFRIKDNDAQIDCAMFASLARKNDFKLTEGQQIEALVSINTIVKMGKYSLNVKKMRLSGKGQLFEMYKKLFTKLSNEGLFEAAHKQQLPKFPKKIGIVTSPTGAAIQDMITTLKRRHPIAQIVVIPCLVQGERATKDIVNKLTLAEEKNFDVIITGRGGGSIEDLWCFNEEVVVRKIHEMQTPVISSVGHESDTTLTDYVADVRAATPTAAAELAACDIYQVNEVIKRSVNYISSSTQKRINTKQMQLEYVKKSQVLNQPLFNQQIVFDNISNRIITNGHRLNQKIEHNKFSLNEIKLEQIIDQRIKAAKDEIKLVHTKIDQLNPLVILSRGYATVMNDDAYVKSIDNVNIDEQINIKMRDGQIISKVIAKEPNENI